MSNVVLSERALRRQAISEARSHLIELAGKYPEVLLKNFDEYPSLVGDLSCLEEVVEILVEKGFAKQLATLCEAPGIGRYASSVIACLVLMPAQP
ncbi:hypothetical protein [Paraburkholderia humisilvae]|uniref:Uncharacterized protein n=1 Tax=Paraburkholderia humisilvae TaxID=627669 RepID=A0A6J5ENH2_9BURK|nr:hypothetical protein [Paraburkholderia humisilvae]CAB3767394.1 hypothetical protein LMG29542_05596 [Paraburkholderia humisilvae]